LFIDGAIVFDGNVVFTDDPGDCICCGDEAPVTCSPCTYSGSASAPPTVEVVATGGDWADLPGTYVLDFAGSEFGYCVYSYFYPEPYPSCTPSDLVPRTIYYMAVYLKTTEAQFGYQNVYYTGTYTIHTYTSAPCNTTRSLDMGSKTTTLGSPCVNLPQITVNI
jgi:hypothetical protein